MGEFSLYALKDFPTVVSAFSGAGFSAIPAFTAAIAWTMGYINEKKADGSVYPRWLIHGATNILSGIFSAF